MIYGHDQIFSFHGATQCVCVCRFVWWFEKSWFILILNFHWLSFKFFYFVHFEHIIATLCGACVCVYQHIENFAVFHTCTTPVLLLSVVNICIYRRSRFNGQISWAFPQNQINTWTQIKTNRSSCNTIWIYLVTMGHDRKPNIWINLQLRREQEKRTPFSQCVMAMMCSAEEIATFYDIELCAMRYVCVRFDNIY